MLVTTATVEQILKSQPKRFGKLWFDRLLDPITRVTALALGRSLSDRGFFHHGNCYIVHYAIRHPRAEELLPLVLQVEPNTDRIHKDCTPIMLARHNLTLIQLLLESGSENRAVIRSFETPNGKISGTSLFNPDGSCNFYAQKPSQQLSIEDLVPTHLTNSVKQLVLDYGLPSSTATVPHFAKCLRLGYYRAVKRFLESDPSLIDCAKEWLTHLIDQGLTRTLNAVLEPRTINVSQNLINHCLIKSDLKNSRYSCLTILLKFYDQPFDWSLVTDNEAAQIILAAGHQPPPKSDGILVLNPAIQSIVDREIHLDKLRQLPWTPDYRKLHGQIRTNQELIDLRAIESIDYSELTLSPLNAISILHGTEYRRGLSKLSPDAAVGVIVIFDLIKWRGTSSETDQWYNCMINSVPVSSWSIPNSYRGPRATVKELDQVAENLTNYLTEFSPATQVIIVRLPLDQEIYQLYLVNDRKQFFIGAAAIAKQYQTDYEEWIKVLP